MDFLTKLKIWFSEKEWRMTLLVGAVLSVMTVALLSPFLGYNDLINASDVLTQYQFVLAAYRDMLTGSGEISLWGRGHLMGGPGGTIGHPIYLQPQRLLLYLLLPVNLIVIYDVIIFLILGGVGTYLYMRTIGVGRFPSFFSALVFIYSTEHISLINAGHMLKIDTIMVFPLVMVFFEKGFQERRLFYFLITGAALGFQFLQHHWQISYYTCLAVALYFFVRVYLIYSKEREWKTIGRLWIYSAVMVVIFFGVASLNFWSIKQWAGQSERGPGMTYRDATNWSEPPEELLAYLNPYYFGISRPNYMDPGKIDVFYWGRMPFTQTADYIGILPVLLALLAAIYKRGKYFWIALVSILFSHLVAMGKYSYLYDLMYYYFPGMKTFRVPKMILFVFVFFASVMAGMGLDWLLNEKSGKEKGFRRFLFSLYAISGSILILSIIAWFFPSPFIGLFERTVNPYGRYSATSTLMGKYQFAVSGFILSSIILGFSTAMIYLMGKGGRYLKLAQIGIVAIFIFDVWFLNYKFISTVPWKDDPHIATSPAIEYIRKDKGLFRVAPLDNTPGNKWSHFRIESIGGYEPVSERIYREYSDHIDLGTATVDLLNVKYLVLSREQMGGEATPSLGTMVLGKYILVYNEDPNSLVFLNTRFIPRAFPVHSVIVEKDKDMIFNILNHPQFRPTDAVVLEETPSQSLPSSPLPSSESRVSITRYSNDEITIKADMAQPGFLVLSEKYYPGWKAYIDGEETKIYKANYVMRAVYLPKGTHKVRFVFDPWPYKVGLWISSATFLFLIGAVMGRRKGYL
jgi:hypothetical protein